MIKTQFTFELNRVDIPFMLVLFTNKYLASFMVNLLSGSSPTPLKNYLEIEYNYTSIMAF